jgi:ribosomal-protein-alanine N-acetyltransferase
MPVNRRSLQLKPELREYVPADFERLWQLDQRCFDREIAYSRGELAYYLRDKTAICLLAIDKDALLGFILGQRDRRCFGHIVTLDIHEKARRLGVGTLLMQTIEQRFRDSGCTSMFLEVAVNNDSAIAFYNKHGYKVLKVLRRYYPGELDGLLMGKLIFDKPVKRSKT